jgi:hypothetical protein
MFYTARFRKEQAVKVPVNRKNRESVGQSTLNGEEPKKNMAEFSLQRHLVVIYFLASQAKPGILYREGREAIVRFG